MSSAEAGFTQPITDPVTGVYSRALLPHRLDGELARAARSGGYCSLFMFDVDFFKTVNDAYGHLRGDDILRQLADRVRAVMRRYDDLFRFGGDEFAVLLPDTGRAEAIYLAQTLAEEIRSQVFHGDPPLHVSISLGVATYPDDGTDAGTLLACADRRNYLAKARGRGGAVADDIDTGATAGSSRLWERDGALTGVHEFLTRLHSAQEGSLAVTGPPGAGHTRFLAEVDRVGLLRGFSVLQLPASTGQPAAAGAALPNVAGTSPNMLILADVDAANDIAPVVAALRASATPPEILGVVYATAGEPAATGVPALGSVELAPWTPAAMQIWLRTSLHGEPSRALVNWLFARSGGLPAQVAGELERLRERGGLVATENGGWTVTSAMLGGLRRQTRLPIPMTELVGREAERTRIVSMLGGSRLVTLVGPGGIGKTRLSLAVAGAVADGFDDGAVFVPLADTTEPELVMTAIATALEVEPMPGRPVVDSVVEHLAEAQLLLVLDNFEQVLDAAGLVSNLLAAAPGITMLITSRERLALYGERTYQVPPLGLPDLDALPKGAAGVERARADYPALALFEQRAEAADADFVLSPETLFDVATLCHRLDGLPLAIELAAARIDRWTPSGLLAHLSNHLDALGDGPRDLPARQQTLRGAIDWSVLLLDPADQILFARLAVFAGGCSIDAALAVVPDRSGTSAVGPDAAALTARLDALANKSLLVVDADPDGAARYRMLETIRAYALARLGDDADAGAARVRHAAHYAALAERSSEELAGPEQVNWSALLEREYQNMRQGFSTAMAGRDSDAAVRFCLGLWRYWANGNYLDEGRDWCDQILDASDELEDATAVELLYVAAVLATSEADDVAAQSFALASLERAESAGDRPGAARAHNALGSAALIRDEYEVAVVHYQQSLAICRELGQIRDTAIALGNLARTALFLDDIEAVLRYADEGLVLERAAGNARNVQLMLECVVDAHLARGDTAAAREALEESRDLSRKLGDESGEAMALHQLGLAALLDGDRTDALRLLTDALGRQHELGDHQDVAVSLDTVARTVVPDDGVLAAELLGAAEALRSQHRLPSPPDLEATRQATLTAAKEALDERTFTTAWTAGRSAPLDLIIDRLLDGVERAA